MAIDDHNPNALIMATIGQAKLLGLDKPQIRDVNSDAVQSISDLMNELANDETQRPQLSARIDYVKNDY